MLKRNILLKKTVNFQSNRNAVKVKATGLQ